jgi:hypothetical protein
MPAWPEIDWARPWLLPWRSTGEPVLRRARRRGLVAALNEALIEQGRAPVSLVAGRLRFVPQAELPRGEAYEAYIARSACVPTRDNLHDFFNGLAWLAYPALKRRLNELQHLQLAAAAPVTQHSAVSGPVRGAVRGAVRDALTLFDENAALWAAPTVLADALRRRDWHALFVTHRSAWAGSPPPLLFGHALLEKLVHPRKPITAHVWLVASDAQHEQGALGGLSVDALAGKPFLPLPVLGVPGWWPGNEEPGFYDDANVFRPPATARVKPAPE